MFASAGFFGNSESTLSSVVKSPRVDEDGLQTWVEFVLGQLNNKDRCLETDQGFDFLRDFGESSTGFEVLFLRKNACDADEALSYVWRDTVRAGELLVYDLLPGIRDGRMEQIVSPS
jgi:hypothetical protein